MYTDNATYPGFQDIFLVSNNFLDGVYLLLEVFGYPLDPHVSIVLRANLSIDGSDLTEVTYQFFALG